MPVSLLYSNQPAVVGYYLWCERGRAEEWWARARRTVRFVQRWPVLLWCHLHARMIRVRFSSTQKLSIQGSGDIFQQWSWSGKAAAQNCKFTASIILPHRFSLTLLPEHRQKLVSLLAHSKTTEQRTVRHYSYPSVGAVVGCCCCSSCSSVLSSEK
mgnify:CR=1 FL=1